LGGEPKYQEAFDKEVQQLAAVARRTTGDARVAVLSGEHATKAAVEKLLASIPARSQLIVNTTSASGATLEKWAGNGRMLITATRSGFERNATHFAEHWAKA